MVDLVAPAVSFAGVNSNLPKIRVLAPCLMLSLLPLLTGAAEPPISRYQIGAWEDDIGYRQAVRVGHLLYVSGSTGAGEMPAAIRGAYGTIERTLKAHGLTFKNVVKENVYTTQLDALKENQAVRKQFYGTEFPAATWVQVARLFDPAYVIEVEVIAVFPE